MKSFSAALISALLVLPGAGETCQEDEISLLQTKPAIQNLGETEVEAGDDDADEEESDMQEESAEIAAAAHETANDHCENKDNGLSTPYGTDCAALENWAYLQSLPSDYDRQNACRQYDFEGGFMATEMCCICGGGELFGGMGPFSRNGCYHKDTTWERVSGYHSVNSCAGACAARGNLSFAMEGTADIVEHSFYGALLDQDSRDSKCRCGDSHSKMPFSNSVGPWAAALGVPEDYYGGEFSYFCSSCESSSRYYDDTDTVRWSGSNCVYRFDSAPTRDRWLPTDFSPVRNEATGFRNCVRKDPSMTKAPGNYHVPRTCAKACAAMSEDYTYYSIRAGRKCFCGSTHAMQALPDAQYERKCQGAYDCPSSIYETTLNMPGSADCLFMKNEATTPTVGR